MIGNDKTQRNRPAGEPSCAEGWVDRLLLRARRITSSGRFVEEIDGLRFVAILWVVVIHCFIYVALQAPTVSRSAATDRAVSFGDVGVQLFFVISGYILAVPFAEAALLGSATVCLRRYLFRRITRLEPPYVLAMVGLFLLTFAFNRRDLQLGELVESLIWSLIYLHGIVLGTKSPINFVTWSLEVEVQFYLLMPVLAMVYRVRHAMLRHGILIGGMVASSAIQIAMSTEWPRLQFTLVGHGQYFLAGLLLADLQTGGWVSRRPIGTPGAIVLLALAGASLSSDVAHRLLLPLLICGLYLAALSRVAGTRWLRNRWIVTIGGMCYSVYLLHLPLISIFGRSIKAIGNNSSLWLDAVIQVPLLCLVVLIGSAVFFVLVERPCMRRDWPTRLRRRVFSNSHATAESET